MLIIQKKKQLSKWSYISVSSLFYSIDHENTISINTQITPKKVTQQKTELMKQARTLSNLVAAFVRNPSSTVYCFCAYSGIFVYFRVFPNVSAQTGSARANYLG